MLYIHHLRLVSYDSIMLFLYHKVQPRADCLLFVILFLKNSKNVDATASIPDCSGNVGRHGSYQAGRACDRTLSLSIVRPFVLTRSKEKKIYHCVILCESVVAIIVHSNLIIEFHNSYILYHIRIMFSVYNFVMIL